MATAFLVISLVMDVGGQLVQIEFFELMDITMKALAESHVIHGVRLAQGQTMMDHVLLASMTYYLWEVDVYHVMMTAQSAPKKITTTVSPV